MDPRRPGRISDLSRYLLVVHGGTNADVTRDSMVCIIRFPIPFHQMEHGLPVSIPP